MAAKLWSVSSLRKVPPFVDVPIDGEWRLALCQLEDGDLGAALVQLVDGPVRIESSVTDQSFEFDALNQRYDGDGVIPMFREQDEPDQVIVPLSDDGPVSMPALAP